MADLGQRQPEQADGQLDGADHQPALLRAQAIGGSEGLRRIEGGKVTPRLQVLDSPGDVVGSIGEGVGRIGTQRRCHQLQVGEQVGLQVLAPRLGTGIVAGDERLGFGGADGLARRVRNFLIGLAPILMRPGLHVDGVDHPLAI